MIFFHILNKKYLNIFLIIFCFVSNSLLSKTIQKNALAVYKSGKEWVVLNENGQKMYSTDKFLDIEQYSYGTLGAYIKENGYVSSVYFNNSGKIQLKSPTNLPFEFINGLALVIQVNDTNPKDAKFGFINTKGKMVVPVKYLDVLPFSDSLAYIMNFDERGYINTKGKFVIRLKKGYAGYGFSEGLSAISSTELSRFGFIDKKGKLVIDYKFEEVGKFSEGLCKVYKDGFFGYINKKGIIVINPRFDEATEFIEGRAFVSIFNFDKNIHEWAIINKDGTLLTLYQFEDKKYFSEGLAAVKKAGVWKYINTEGKDNTNKTYKFAGSFKNGKALVVTEDDKNFFINKNEEKILELPDNCQVILDCRTNERFDILENNK